MDYCKVCKHEMKQIPIRKLAPILVVEHYCPICDKSEITYENIEST